MVGVLTRLGEDMGGLLQIFKAQFPHSGLIFHQKCADTAAALREKSEKTGNI